LRKQESSRGKYILVFNATTLITLMELNRLDLVEKLRETQHVKVVIPQSVKNEFLEAGIELNISSDEMPIEKIDILPIEIPRRLGEGELHAIALAYTLTQQLSKNNVTTIVVTDDKQARKKCEKLGIKVFETLGLIEFAKKHRVISKEKALEILEKIPSTSLYTTQELLKEAQTKIKQQ